MILPPRTLDPKFFTWEKVPDRGLERLRLSPRAQPPHTAFGDRENLKKLLAGCRRLAFDSGALYCVSQFRLPRPCLTSFVGTFQD